MSLDRSVPTLSGGEGQRLKLATQFGTGLSNILYIMDEPSKGLHPKDYSFLMKVLVDLKNNNNTVVLVEHKKSFLKIADLHLELGPKAGQYGGELMAIEDRKSIQASLENWDDHNQFVTVDEHDRDFHGPYIEMIGVKTNNLKDLNVKFLKAR